MSHARRISTLAMWNSDDPEAELCRSHWGAHADIVFDDELGQLDEEARGRIEIVVGVPRREQLDVLPNVGLICLHTHGADRLLRWIPSELLRARSIRVVRSTASAIAVAEFSIGALIALTRRLVPIHTALIEDADWSLDLRSRRMQGVWGGELYGATLGIIGMGAIGGELRVRAEAMGMCVRALSRSPERLQNVQAFGYDERDRFFAGSDYVVACVPDAPETRRLIDERAIGAMAEGSYVVNVARASVIDLEAVIAGLRSGQLAGAAIDVWESEPHLAGGAAAAEQQPSGDWPFERLRGLNVLATPHYSAATREARLRIFSMIGENVAGWCEGRPLEREIGLPG
jgi:phosphoglycerate dehydrogenase-like enzyme